MAEDSGLDLVQPPDSSSEDEGSLQVSVIRGDPSNKVVNSLQSKLNSELARLHLQGHKYIGLSLASDDNGGMVAGIVYQPKPASKE